MADWLFFLRLCFRNTFLFDAITVVFAQILYFVTCTISCKQKLGTPDISPRIETILLSRSTVLKKCELTSWSHASQFFTCDKGYCGHRFCFLVIERMYEQHLISLYYCTTKLMLTLSGSVRQSHEQSTYVGTTWCLLIHAHEQCIITSDKY